MYYAVYKGYKPGIYLSWDECKVNVLGYKGAIFKKFNDLNSANNFVNQNYNNTISTHSDLAEITNLSENINLLETINIENSTIRVSTDGSCYNNGKQTAFGGYGIYFGQNDPRNVSKAIIGNVTNNIAELTAIIHAFSILENEINKGIKIEIVTDSKYCIKCFTDYGRKCENKNWGKNESKTIPNLDLVKKGYYIVKHHPNITFIHVYSHTNNKDIYSIENSHVDLLAKAGLCKSISLSNNVGDVTFKLGKYKGKSIKQIYNTDISYINWFLTNNVAKKDTMFTYILQEYINRKTIQEDI